MIQKPISSNENQVINNNGFLDLLKTEYYRIKTKAKPHKTKKIY